MTKKKTINNTKKKEIKVSNVKEVISLLEKIRADVLKAKLSYDKRYNKQSTTGYLRAMAILDEYIYRVNPDRKTQYSIDFNNYSATKHVSNGECMVKGTLVKTGKGLIPIEDISSISFTTKKTVDNVKTPIIKKNIIIKKKKVPKEEGIDLKGLPKGKLLNTNRKYDEDKHEKINVIIKKKRNNQEILSSS
jgi:hypothetical protein